MPRPEVEHCAADIAKLVGALLCRTLAEILSRCSTAELVGDLLALGLVLLPLCEELFLCVHYFPPT